MFIALGINYLTTLRWLIFALDKPCPVTSHNQWVPLTLDASISRPPMKVVLSMYQASRKEGNAILITTWDIVTVTILSYKWGNGDLERLVKLPDIMQPIWIEPGFTATWPHTECFWWRHFFIHCSETGRGRENTQIDSLIASLTVNPWLR